MEDANYSQKSKKLNQSSNSIEISDDEEIVLSPIETIAWDAFEVSQIFTQVDWTASYTAYLAEQSKLTY